MRCSSISDRAVDDLVVEAEERRFVGSCAAVCTFGWWWVICERANPKDEISGDPVTKRKWGIGRVSNRCYLFSLEATRGGKREEAGVDGSEEYLGECRHLAALACLAR